MAETKENYLKFLLMLADNSLIIGQRLSEWCGHGPVLEQDIAMTNIALDCIGQARMLYQYAAEYEGQGRDEDDMAYLRTERNYRNLLLCEQPNNDFAHTIVRQYIFDVWQNGYYSLLANSSDERLAAIAVKSLKEAKYHLKYSGEWVKRLGSGTEESHRRMQAAVDELWRFAGEAYIPVDFEAALIGENRIPDVTVLKEDALNGMTAHFESADLKAAQDTFMQNGGKTGYHTEHLGYILTELQYMQRAYPGSKW